VIAFIVRGFFLPGVESCSPIKCPFSKGPFIHQLNGRDLLLVLCGFRSQLLGFVGSKRFWVGACLYLCRLRVNLKQRREFLDPARPNPLGYGWVLCGDHGCVDQLFLQKVRQQRKAQ
jgi:hypothetical protein